MTIGEEAWVTAYKAENKKHFEAILTNQKLDRLEMIEINREKITLPKRQTLKLRVNLVERQNDPKSDNYKCLDGFFLVRM